MIILKIVLGLIFTLILFFACFSTFPESSWKKRLIIILGIIPYFAFLLLVGFLIRLLYPKNLLFDKITETYIGFFLLPYLILAVRLFLNTGFGETAKIVLRKGMKEKNIEKNLGHFFFVQSIFFFIVGVFIIIQISIKEIPNSLVANKLNKRPNMLEKWILISNDDKVLNQVANSQFNFQENIQNDTLTYILNDDNSSGWIINKKDSIRVSYSFNVDELAINRNNKSWILKVLSKSENKMTIGLSDSSSITLIKSE